MKTILSLIIGCLLFVGQTSVSNAGVETVIKAIVDFTEKDRKDLEESQSYLNNQSSEKQKELYVKYGFTLKDVDKLPKGEQATYMKALLQTNLAIFRDRRNQCAIAMKSAMDAQPQAQVMRGYTRLKAADIFAQYKLASKYLNKEDTRALLFGVINTQWHDKELTDACNRIAKCLSQIGGEQ